MADPTVREIMDFDPVNVSPTTDVGAPSLHLPHYIELFASVHEAARLISHTGHNRIPVVEDAKLLGVVTRVDALTRAGV